MKSVDSVFDYLLPGSHSDYWHPSVREIRATNSVTIHTTGCTTEIR